MSIVTAAVGEKIRIYRKKQQMTLDELAKRICKSKATVSKYEKGEIAMDVDTLYEVADALQVHVNQLLYAKPEAVREAENGNGAFFRNLDRFYGYIFDGRENKVIRCCFEPGDHTEGEQQRVCMYMNFRSYEQYQLCENTYEGYMEHYDAVTNILLVNRHLPMEKASIQLLASSLDAAERMGLWNGLSTRPLMPIATKILLSKKPLPDTPELAAQLRISSNDLKLFRLYNMFPVL